MRKILLDQVHLLGLGLSLILLVAVAVVSFASWEEYVVAANATRNSRTAISGLKDLLVNVQNAETGERGFLLTGDAQYLEPYMRAVPTIRSEINSIDPRKADLIQDAVLIKQLQAAVRDKMSELRATVALRTRGDAAGALELLKTGKGNIEMDRIRELESELERHEDLRLSRQRDRSRYFARLSQLTSTLGSCGIFVVVLLSAVKINRLVSARNRLNAELSRSAAAFQHLADSVPQMIWQTDDIGAIQYVNRRWTDFSGLLVETTSEGAWRTLLHPEDRKKFLDLWQESLHTGGQLAVECRLKGRSTGRYRWFLFRAGRARDERFGRARWYGAYTDIDQQKITEQALQRSNDDLQQFVYSASHDLQEPLRTMMLYSQRVIERNPDRLGTELERDIQFLGESADRMRALVSDLLTYTEITGYEADSQEASDLTLALMAALTRLQSAIEQTQTQITYTALPIVIAPGPPLRQLFQNLIGNAIKYRKKNATPQVSVSAVQRNAEWIIQVRDEGIGIDPAYHDKIFGIFKRLHTAAEYQGTGLGLAICKKIVERYHGRIWVESKLGEGATFCFSLPAATNG